MFWREAVAVTGFWLVERCGSLGFAVSGPALALEGQRQPGQRRRAAGWVEVVDEEEECVLDGLLCVLGAVAVAFRDSQQPLSVGEEELLGERFGAGPSGIGALLGCGCDFGLPSSVLDEAAPAPSGRLRNPSGVRAVGASVGRGLKRAPLAPICAALQVAGGEGPALFGGWHRGLGRVRAGCECG